LHLGRKCSAHKLSTDPRQRSLRHETAACEHAVASALQVAGTSTLGKRKDPQLIEKKQKVWSGLAGSFYDWSSAAVECFGFVLLQLLLQLQHQEDCVMHSCYARDAH
jgi:hypothetical protein